MTDDQRGVFYRIVQPHVRLDEDDYHEWVFLGDTVQRDRIGRISGSTTEFLVVRCNNPDCRGKALVRTHDVCWLVPRRFA